MLVSVAFVAAGSPRARIALLIFDTRPLKAEDGKFAYWRSVARLNAAYACERGYDFLYYRMRSPPGSLQHFANFAGNTSQLTKMSKHLSPLCYQHGRTGRSASWCRLPAIAHALSLGYERVLNLGSDAFLKFDAPELEDIIRAHHPTVYAHKWPPVAMHIRKSPHIIFGSNAPWSWGYRMHTSSHGNNCGGPNGDFVVYERSVGVWELLRKWWGIDDLCSRPFNTAGGFLQEQSALTNCRALRLDEYAVLCSLQWNNKHLWSKLPGMHVSSAQAPNAREQLITQRERAIPERLASCVASKYVEIDFNATMAASTLLESEDAKRAFVQSPPVPDVLGLNGSQWFNGCPGPPICMTSTDRPGRQSPAKFSHWPATQIPSWIRDGTKTGQY